MLYTKFDMDIKVVDLVSDNAQVWWRFVCLHKWYLSKFVYTCVLDLKLTEEIVQDVFLAVWKNRYLLPEDSDLKQYMFRCARNICLNYWRNTRFHTISIDELDLNPVYRRSNSCLLEGEALNKLFEDDLQKIIRNTLGKMSRQTQEIFTMSRDQNLSNKEIAQKMNLSEKAIEYHISKVIKQIKRELSKEY